MFTSLRAFVRLSVLLLLGCLSANADAARLLYSDGHELDSARLAALGHTHATFTPNDAGWTGALSGAYGAFDAIVVGEGASWYPLSSSTRTAINSFVSNGGRLIVISDHDGNVGFMNNVLGFSTVVEYGCESDDSVAGSLLSAASGTSFAGGPATVGNGSCTSALVRSSVPTAAKTMYGDADTALVFAMPSGRGTISWLGFDFCCGSEQVMDDWYIVLDNALRFTAFTTCAAQGYTGGRLTMCRQVCEVPQTPSTLAGLIKIYNILYREPLTCPAATR